jgi:hypothetical protein
MKLDRGAAVRGIACPLLLLLLSALSGCATREVGLSKEDLDRFRTSPSVKSLRRVPPSFAVHSPWEVALPVAGVTSAVVLPMMPDVTSSLGVFESAGDAAGKAAGPAFGILSAEGAVAYGLARRRGGALVSPFRLDDPAGILQEDFVYTLGSSGKGMAKEIAPHPEPLPAPTRRSSTLLSRTADPEELKALKERVGDVFLLDFQTTDWGLLYYTWDWDRYRVRYAATARLLDLTGPPRVAWEGRCQVIEDEYVRRPLLQDYLADNATLLRTRLLDAAEDCSRQLWRKFAAAP